MLQRDRCAAWTVLTLVISTHFCTCAHASSRAEDVDEALLPVDLTVNTFDGALQGLPVDRWALIEFFASWCPACQHFKPTYEKVSAALRREPLPQPEVWVARVDCATEVWSALRTLAQSPLRQSAVNVNLSDVAGASFPLKLTVAACVMCLLYSAGGAMHPLSCQFVSIC